MKKDEAFSATILKDSCSCNKTCIGIYPALLCAAPCSSCSWTLMDMTVCLIPVVFCGTCLGAGCLTCLFIQLSGLDFLSFGYQLLIFFKSCLQTANMPSIVHRVLFLSLLFLPPSLLALPLLLPLLSPPPSTNTHIHKHTHSCIHTHTCCAVLQTKVCYLCLPDPAFPAIGHPLTTATIPSAIKLAIYWSVSFISALRLSFQVSKSPKIIQFVILDFFLTLQIYYQGKLVLEDSFIWGL